MELETMLYHKESGIATITLNRPDKLNSINETWIYDFPKVLEEANLDNEVRVIIITGAGTGFCAGADVTELGGMDGLVTRLLDKSPLYGRQWFALQVLHLEKPVIAAVNGPAGGGGVCLALACDIVIASEKATFSVNFIDRGLVPDSGGAFFIPRLVGVKKACELMFTGDKLDADQAKECGIVNRVVPHDQLMPAAQEMAAKIAAKAPLAMKLTKRVIYYGATNDVVPTMELEGYLQLELFRTEDFQEGVASFLEKRQPKFKGK